MKKTLFILIVVALLGILAAAIAPGSNSKTTANTSSTTATQTATTPTATTATTPAASSSTTTTPAASTTSSSQYKDGSYTGTVATNYYDEIQVAVVISNGKITAITTPTLTGDSGHSNQINSYAVPKLTKQAIAAQSSSIDGVSGASYTTESYVSSLQSALDKAKA